MSYAPGRDGSFPLPLRKKAGGTSITENVINRLPLENLLESQICGAVTHTAEDHASADKAAGQLAVRKSEIHLQHCKFCDRTHPVGPSSVCCPQHYAKENPLVDHQCSFPVTNDGTGEFFQALTKGIANLTLKQLGPEEASPCILKSRRLSEDLEDDQV